MGTVSFVRLKVGRDGFSTCSEFAESLGDSERRTPHPCVEANHERVGLSSRACWKSRNSPGNLAIRVWIPSWEIRSRRSVSQRSTSSLVARSTGSGSATTAGAIRSATVFIRRRESAFMLSTASCLRKQGNHNILWLSRHQPQQGGWPGAKPLCRPRLASSATPGQPLLGKSAEEGMGYGGGFCKSRRWRGPTGGARNEGDRRPSEAAGALASAPPLANRCRGGRGTGDERPVRSGVG
jgi:hypothetical protein